MDGKPRLFFQCLRGVSPVTGILSRRPPPQKIPRGEPAPAAGSILVRPRLLFSFARCLPGSHEKTKAKVGIMPIPGQGLVKPLRCVRTRSMVMKKHDVLALL